MTHKIQFRYTEPTIGRNHYVVLDPTTRHSTMVERRVADGALVQLLGDVPLELAVDGFLATSPPANKVQWEHVKEYVIKLLQIPDGDLIEDMAIVAFWAAVVIERRQREGN